MNQPTSKAQTATEYLIILAVVIIIALIVVGVLGGIPGIGGSSKGQTSTAYWASQTIGVSYSFAQRGNDVLVLTNNMNNPVRIDSVRLDTSINTVGTASNSSSTGNMLFTNPSSDSSSNQTLNSGQSYKYQNASLPATYVASKWVGTNCNEGETFSVYINVDWRDVTTGNRYTFDGGRKPLEGTCAR